VPTIDEMREVAKRRDALSAEWVEAFRSRDNKRRADIEAQLDGLRLENDVWKWLGALCDVVEAADELVPAAVAYIDAEAEWCSANDRETDPDFLHAAGVKANEAQAAWKAAQALYRHVLAELKGG
jgi:hypothetical protein